MILTAIMALKIKEMSRSYEQLTKLFKHETIIKNLFIGIFKNGVFYDEQDKRFYFKRHLSKFIFALDIEYKYTCLEEVCQTGTISDTLLCRSEYELEEPVGDFIDEINSIILNLLNTTPDLI